MVEQLFKRTLKISESLNVVCMVFAIYHIISRSDWSTITCSNKNRTYPSTCMLFLPLNPVEMQNVIKQPFGTYKNIKHLGLAYQIQIIKEFVDSTVLPLTSRLNVPALSANR